MHWVTYRRAPLAVPAGLPVLTTITVNGKARQDAWAEETVRAQGLRPGPPAHAVRARPRRLQVLTSDFDACPAEILAWLKSRWREENFLKYASGNYGIDKICDYIATVETNTKVIDNPARKAANATLRQAEKNLAAASADMLPCSPTRPSPPPSRTPGSSPPPGRRSRGREGAHRRPKPPATRPPRSCPPTSSTRTPRSRCCAPAGAACRLVLRLLAHNAEHWIASAPQRLPAGRRRVPGHHPPERHPRPRRRDHLHPRQRSACGSTSPAAPCRARA